MKRTLSIGACVVLGLAAVAFARQGVVTTTADLRYTGDVDASAPDKVTVLTHGVEITIDRPDVRSIEYLDQVDQEYHDKMAKLGPVDIPGRLDVARWAMDLRRLDLAFLVADQATTISPNDKDALALRTSIMQEMASEHPTTIPANPGSTDVLPPLVLTGNATPPAPATNPIIHPLLGPDDIQEIRRNELKFTDTSVKLRFDNDVRKRYAIAQGIDPNAFALRPQVEQAIAILSGADKSLITDVKVLTDPSAIAAFKIRVQPTVVMGCATSGCHGGAAGGDLYLYSTPDTESQLYTNFYALQSYSHQVKTTGPFGEGMARRQMIDRTNPSESLLLQYGLPPGIAQNPHPPLTNYNGLFHNTDDPRYLAIQGWISNALLPLEPAYDIPRPILHHATTEPTTNAAPAADIPPATAPPATQAATTPSTKQSN